MNDDRHVESETLAALALEDTEDLSAIELHWIRAHVEGCARCAADLDGLRSTLALVRSSGAESLEQAPSAPSTVWQAISAELDLPEDDRTTIDLPQPAGRRGVPTWLAGLAAATTLVAGVGLGYLLAPQPATEPETGRPSPEAEVLTSAALATLDASAADRGTAQVRRDGDRVVLHVEATGLGEPQGIREVWLINVDGTRMVALGLLNDGESGDFEFPKRLLNEGYRIVDISYEPDDGDPVHSGKSLARGTLEG